MKTKFYTHINRNVIDSNRKRGRADPPVSVRRGRRGRAVYATEVELPEGSRLIYSPDKPLLPCGARMVIESDTMPRVVR